ncbi:MAG: long-chain fatty acid--CoA ligase, partial [Acidobacteria bacterium]|nr:long-chain fatty acid--CoA ligase [Acidobacteriota bacterium]
DQAAYVASDCDAEVVFVQGRDRYQGMLDERAEIPRVRQFVVIDADISDVDTVAFADLLRDTEPQSEEAFEASARQSKPEDLATFIYTSGTTGNPKGVMLTHGNLTSNLLSASQAIEIHRAQTGLSFLPLSHSFERVVDYIYFLKGATIAYAESVQTVGQNLLEVRPHFFVAVPRVYEKVINKVREKVANAPPLRQKIFAWAEKVGRQALPWRLRREWPSGLLGLQLKIADKLVFAKIRARLGGRFESATSGGAPLAQNIAEFFWAAGIEIYEGYGLSETSPVLTVNRPGKVKLGSVGAAIEGVELRIAEDGEILAQGPNVMRGYYNLPEKTAEAIDDEGWFHTGDIGEMDDEGFLKITDRKKEIIVNAYGKNIAPAPIENLLKSSRFIEQVVVIGDRYKFLSALVVPDFEALLNWAKKSDVPSVDRRELLASEATRELFETEIARVNEELSKHQMIRAFDLLSEEFSIEGGELTPTQKIKRRIIATKYEHVIDDIYERAEG